MAMGFQSVHQARQRVLNSPHWRKTGNNMPLAVLAGGSDAVSGIVAFPAPPDGVVLPGAFRFSDGQC